MSRLSGKVAIVTGASRGIGRAVAVRLAAESAWVGVNYQRNEAGARETLAAVKEAGGEGELLPFDVSDANAVEEAIKNFAKERGKIDILVNNAGVVHNGLLLRTKPADLERVFAVNVGGVFHCTKAVSGAMMKSRSGRIINLTSIVGETGNAGQSVYAASKAAVIGLTKSAARELAPRHITVNAVSPGFVSTDMTANLTKKQTESILSTIPLGRMGTTDEVAEAVAFLTLPATGYITGHVLDVNGGMLM